MSPNDDPHTTYQEIDFSGVATYDKVKRIRVLARRPGYDFQTDEFWLHKSEGGWEIILPPYADRHTYRQSFTVSRPYPLKTAKKLATALLNMAGTPDKLEELRGCSVLPAWVSADELKKITG